MADFGRCSVRQFESSLIDLGPLTKSLNEFRRACRLFRMCRNSAPEDRLSPGGRNVMSKALQQLFATALVIGFAFEVCPVIGQETVRSLPPSTYQVSQNVNELYIAIMGEVAKPGTYHVNPTSLNLHSMVQRAGGFTADASPTIRIIRNGRPSHKEVFSERVNCPLKPGDLLVVESKLVTPGVSQSFDPGPEPTAIHANYQVRPSRPGVQIGLVNVVDYPIVLTLRTDEANAGSIVEKLGQPDGILAKTDLFPRASTESSKNAIRLVAGSVMVFPKGRVDRNRLPATLPRPIESDIAMGAQSGLIGSPSGQSSELRSLGQQLTPGFDNSASLPIRSDLQSLLPAETDPSNDIRMPTMPSAEPRRPRIATLPFSGQPRIASSSIEIHKTDVPNDAIPQPDDAAEEDDPANESDLEVDSVSVKTASFSWLQLSIILLVVGALIGAAVTLRHVLETKPNSDAAKQQRAPSISAAQPMDIVTTSQTNAKTLLERLIKNEIPITVESIEFPTGLTLQGRIASQPVLRVDGPQSILKQGGPHIPAVARGTTEPGLQDVIAQLDKAESGQIRRPHFMNSEPRDIANSAKAPTEPHETGSANAGEAPKAPLAKALIELEQGGRT